MLDNDHINIVTYQSLHYGVADATEPANDPELFGLALDGVSE